MARILNVEPVAPADSVLFDAKRQLWKINATQFLNWAHAEFSGSLVKKVKVRILPNVLPGHQTVRAGRAMVITLLVNPSNVTFDVAVRGLAYYVIVAAKLDDKIVLPHAYPVSLLLEGGAQFRGWCARFGLNLTGIQRGTLKHKTAGAREAATEWLTKPESEEDISERLGKMGGLF